MIRLVKEGGGYDGGSQQCLGLGTSCDENVTMAGYKSMR